jgi:SAM-dependent methyltransferase
MANQCRKVLSRAWYAIGKRSAWSLGYIEYRWHLTYKLLKQTDFLTRLQLKQPFTAYGIGLDERVIEYPWVFANLSQGGLLLDAGSALNFLGLIRLLKDSDHELMIYTLAPERKCFWNESVSYHFGDLRNQPFKSGLFDNIVCISTLEHIGMDNQNYGYTSESISENDFILAVNEMSRVLKTGGNLLITLPYGYRDYVKWNNSIFMRQFDAELLQLLIQSQPHIQFEVCFFKYTAQGWQQASQDECENVHYFNMHHEKDAPDGAASARAIACLKGIKQVK